MARVAAGMAPERQSRLMIIAAVVFAAIAAVLVFAALRGNDDGGGGGAAAATRDVVVASQSIDVNEVITADMLEMKAIPEDYVLDGTYSETKPLIGVPARYALQEGEQITTGKIGLSQIEDEKDLGLVVPPGKRAAAIEVTEMTSVGGLLLPGNNVDIIAVFRDPDGVGLRSVVVAQNMEVLSVAQEAQEPVPAAASEETAGGADEPADATGGAGLQGQRPDDVERQPGARTVTVAATPQQALILAALQVDDSDFDVSLYLVLRNEGDEATTPAQAIDVSPFIFPQPPER